MRLERVSWDMAAETLSTVAPPASLRSEAGPADSLPVRILAAWRRSDAIYDLLEPEALHAQPIPLRQPFIFYLGHLPAFAWNHLGARLLGRGSLHPRFEDLFSRGIDPIGVDAHAAGDRSSWPPVAQILVYREQVRAALSGYLAHGGRRAREQRLLGMVLEHELMHHETLLYMAQQLPLDQKRAPASVTYERGSTRLGDGSVKVPAGRARLGASPADLAFGWDNEFPAHEVDVPAFTIDELPVTNAELLEFVRAGGYDRTDLWDDAAWAWRQRRGLDHPLGWSRTGGAWTCRTLFHEVPFEEVALWPASVSWAEAAAFARWRGRRLPTEAEFHRAAYGSPDGIDRRHPWGDAEPREHHGNFEFHHWSPTPVGSRPSGASAWGVEELVGNGWEWTRTPFGPFPGFERMPEYPGYSQDFFDDRHYVLRGASWATDRALVRPSFRNWFQPHYPYVFSKFRLVNV